MSFHILIVDDERLSRSYIRDLVKEFEPEALIFEAKSAAEAKQIIDEGEIDILFLDIQMPGANGFSLLESLETRGFELVFITAHSEFAIRAIKEGATDYLLKPIKKSEFKKTLELVIEKHQDKYRKGLQTLNGDEQERYLSNKLSLNHQQGIKFILLKDIVYLKADNTYTTIHLANGDKIITSKPISKFNSSLDPNWFFRIHKSYIINIYHFSEYISKDGDIALMNNGDKLYISRYRLNQFLELIRKVTGELKI